MVRIQMHFRFERLLNSRSIFKKPNDEQEILKNLLSKKQLREMQIFTALGIDFELVCFSLIVVVIVILGIVFVVDAAAAACRLFSLASSFLLAQKFFVYFRVFEFAMQIATATKICAILLLVWAMLVASKLLRRHKSSAGNFGWQVERRGAGRQTLPKYRIICSVNPNEPQKYVNFLRCQRQNVNMSV